MDCVWHALSQWHGISKRKTKGCWVGNEVYFSAASRMAADCQTELPHWTTKLGGVNKLVQIGNIMQTCAIFLVKGNAWKEMCSIMHCLAFHDAECLCEIVAGCAVGGISGQAARPPSPDVHAPGGTKSTSDPWLKIRDKDG